MCGCTKKFISNELDLKVAITTALTFAILNNIPYKYEIQLDRPIVTICKKNSKWYPAELHSDKIRLLTSIKNYEISGDLEEAKCIAIWIAVKKETYCLLNLGLTLPSVAKEKKLVEHQS